MRRPWLVPCHADQFPLHPPSVEQDDNNTKNNIPDEADGEDRDLPAHPSSAWGGRELAVYVVLHRSGEHYIKAKIL